VGGAGRSGSTLLALLLARLPGFVAVGGVNNLWQRGLRDNYLCGCGLAFRDCDFWRRVGLEAFGGWERVDAGDVLRLQREVTRYRQWPSYLVPRLRASFFERVDEYSEYVARVYAAIRSASGASIVVDNSHDVTPALLLWRTPAVRLHLLHLVRDSRGVAFSLAKRVARPEATAPQALMPRYSPARASLEWLVANLPFHVVHAGSLPRLRVRYEALAASPSTELARIASFLGVDVSPPELAIAQGDSITVATNHMVSGNPHRLGRSTVQVRLDEEWRTGMATTDRLVVTLMTMPLTLAYGYFGRHPSRVLSPRLKARGA
jgi:hypothetical protein